MKKNIVNNFMGIIIGIIVTLTVIAAAAGTINSENVLYNNTSSGLSATNVQDAVDSLYNNSLSNKNNTINALKDKGYNVDTDSTNEEVINGINSIPVTFGQDENDNWGYYMNGDSTLHPFGSFSGLKISGSQVLYPGGNVTNTRDKGSSNGADFGWGWNNNNNYGDSLTGGSANIAGGNNYVWINDGGGYTLTSTSLTITSSYTYQSVQIPVTRTINGKNALLYKINLSSTFSADQAGSSVNSVSGSALYYIYNEDGSVYASGGTSKGWTSTNGSHGSNVSYEADTIANPPTGSYITIKMTGSSGGSRSRSNSESSGHLYSGCSCDWPKLTYMILE